MKIREILVVSGLVVIAFSIMFYKIVISGLSMREIMPDTSYEFTAYMEFDGHGNTVRMRMALPVPLERQDVRNEVFGAEGLRFSIEHGNGNRFGVWQSREVSGHRKLLYSGTVNVRARLYELAPDLKKNMRYAPEVARYLLSSENIQSDDPEVVSLLDRLIPPSERGDLNRLFRVLFDYAHHGIKKADFTGTTDALTCLRLGESSCGGKSRLLAALLRSAGVPACLAGGVILKSGTWTSSHVWVEAYAGDRWIPFCPLNGYYAEIPASYLTLYHGEEALFTHTKDINFKYRFHAKPTLEPPVSALSGTSAPAGGLLNLWKLFEQVRIPVNLLKIILLIPIGALAVVIGRNIIGIETFGTFMPVLIAVAFRDTGFWWGIVLFIIILAFGALVRQGVDRLRLLHTPRIAILMTSTVAFMLAITVAGVVTGHVLPTRVSLFPIVILTLTVERFAIILEEDGWRRAVVTVAGTVIVAAASYTLMNWRVAELTVVTFPETLLIVAAFFVLIGRWRGMRLLEYVRFKHFPVEGDET